MGQRHVLRVLRLKHPYVHDLHDKSRRTLARVYTTAGELEHILLLQEGAGVGREAAA